MRRFCLHLMLICLTALESCSKSSSSDNDKPTKDDLDARYGAVWKSYRNVANTAVNETYPSAEEKQVFYYLNPARINPPLFAETYAAGYNGDKGYEKRYTWDGRKQSLIEELKAMAPLSPVVPDTAMYEMASCFARKAGRLGIVGHDRSGTSCTKKWGSECCDYGGTNGLSIIMTLLIDDGNVVPDNRHECLNDVKYGLGVAIR